MLKKVATVSKISEKRFSETREVDAGKNYSMLVLSTMQPKYQKKGIHGEKYKKAEHYYEMAMADTFYNLLVSHQREKVVKRSTIRLVNKRSGVRIPTGYESSTVFACPVK